VIRDAVRGDFRGYSEPDMRKAAPASGAAVFGICTVSLRWHYPDQVPRVGADGRGRNPRGRGTLSAWLPKLP